MTDITELAQRVKTEASAIDDTQWYLAKPSEIRSLVEALEKAQRKANIFDLFPDDYVITNGPMELIEKQAKRIADLESRTVTVKLAEDKPAESESEVDDAEAWFDEGWNARGEADRDALAAAGIKVEAE